MPRERVYLAAACALTVACQAAAFEPLLTLSLSDTPDDRPAVATAVALSLDGTRIAAGGDDHKLRVWDASTGDPVGTLTGHDGWVRAARFTGPGVLASVAADHTLCLWDLTADAERRTLRRVAGGPLLAVAIHPDGRRVATAGFADSLRVFDLAADAAAEPAEFGCPCQDTRAVAYSPDGRWLAAAGRNGVVRLWDRVASGGPRDLPSDGRRVRAIAFAPDGRTLATGGDGPAVRLWRLDSDAFRSGADGLAPSELLVRPGKVHALSWVDDRLLAVGGTSNAIRLWDAGDASPRATLRGHTGTVAALAASPAGDRLVSGSFDTTVRVWELDPAALRAARTASVPAQPTDAGVTR